MSNSYQNNAIRGPINSWFFRLISGYMNCLFGQSKRRLFKDHPDTVVEIGSGAGANMRYFRVGTNLIAIEPNVHMHLNLQNSADKYGINLDIRTVIGEQVDLPENSCDFVVCTLVLCTVENPSECLSQIKKILKPNGVFVFIEHVKAQENTFLAWLQNLLHQPWHWFFEGCHTNRDTRNLIESSGFSLFEIESYKLYSPFLPIVPQIRGRAIK